MNEYLVGNVLKITALFRDENLILVDPDAVFLLVNVAGETVVSYQYGVGSQVTKRATGTYETELLLDRVGGWNYYWQSSGTASAQDGQFLVTLSGI